MAPSLTESKELLDGQPRPYKQLSGEPDLHNGQPVEYVRLARRADGGDIVAPAAFKQGVPTNSNGFRLRLPTGPRVVTPVAPEIDRTILGVEFLGDEILGDLLHGSEALASMSMKRRRDSAFPDCSKEASKCEDNSEFAVDESPMKKLEVDSPPCTKRISAQTPTSADMRISAIELPDTALRQGKLNAGPIQASATPSGLAAEPPNTAPFRGTPTSTQPQSSTTPILAPTEAANAETVQGTAAPTTRQLSLHRDMPPYVGIRPIPPWLSNLSTEIRAAKTDSSSGRIKNGSLKKITKTFVRAGTTLSHFSPASGVLRVGQSYSPLWEWWMDTRVLTPLQWWAVNEVIWKSHREGCRELPAACLGMKVFAEI
ncbi:hypothetical protein CERZMDRAFT_81171 [Cercospora zeae-maydis SCOH1-5]|uniref:Uncharacterized protein n=1 Tax=Cercospora zeae-maydis SCOH1-5 TaxID=717836 RepID=A0A6A6FV27_9PEZI|nr:hypothetical protein CERZMDRAFT_81171 [Cercospora zeae-maydis SCOH1-5]